MNKKAQAQLIANVVIGMILLVIIFVIFWWISGRLKDMKQDSITDNQSLSVYDGYVLMLGEIHGEDELEEFVALMDGLRKSEGYLGNDLMFKNYKTFEDDITRYQTKVVNKNLDSYVIVLGEGGEMRSFEMYPLFFKTLRKTVCGYISDRQWTPGYENNHNYEVRVNQSKLYLTNYCRIEEVLNE